MFSRHAFDKPLRSRPWLLLWLLPYLLLSVAADGLHNHPLGEGDDLCRAGCVQTTVATPGTSAAAHTASDECLACQWAAQSVAHLAAAPAALTLSAQVFRLTSSFAFLPTPTFGNCRNRGPPLS